MELVNLANLFEAQGNLQIEAYGKHPEDIIDPVERIQFFKDMQLALTDELHEALAEMGWKPWATSRHFNEDAVKGELVDAFHFFMNLCMVAGMDAQELMEKYYVKRQKNIQRQIDGYDGVSTKCPGCGRALDDEAVHCRRNVKHPTQEVWCVVKLHWVRFPEAVKAKK